MVIQTIGNLNLELENWNNFEFRKKERANYIYTNLNKSFLLHIIIWKIKNIFFLSGTNYLSKGEKYILKKLKKVFFT